jgi:hypothetical protein
VIKVKAERADRLRRRPERVRYFFLAVSDSMLHTGLSHGGLQYANNKHNITDLYLSDLVTDKVIHVTEPLVDFMNRWRLHYNDPTWDYEDEIAKGIVAPKF